MEIIVLDINCPNYKTTYDRVTKVIADTNGTATLRKEEDILAIVKYNVLSSLALSVVAGGKYLI